MPRFNEILNNFINGEVSPKLYGRTDSEMYKKSCRTVTNMIVHPQGGVSRRMGSQYLSNIVYDPDNNGDTDTFGLILSGTRLIPFYFDNDEKYVLMFVPKLYHADFYAAVNFYNVDRNTYGYSLFLASPAYLGTAVPVTPIDPATSTGINSASWADVDVLKELQFTQVGAYCVLVHGSLPPAVVVRVRPDVLTFHPYAFQYTDTDTTSFGPYPFMEINKTDITVTVASTALASGISMTSSDPIFNSQHVGSYFGFAMGGVVGYALITFFISTSSVTVTITRVLPSGVTLGTKNWFEGAWSDYRGWPKTVAYSNGALFFGGNKTFPNRIWKSQTKDIFEMTNFAQLDSASTSVASDPFFADLAITREVGTIQWMSHSGRDLMVGTQTGEFAVPFFEHGNFDAKPQSAHGSEYIQPCKVGTHLVFVQRGFRKLRETVFSAESEAYAAQDLTLLADHITRKSTQLMSGAAVNPKIKQIEYMALDNELLWAIDTNGMLISCTRSSVANIAAFAAHTLGAGGKVTSICTLPSKNLTYDELYMIVERTVNSVAVVYLEKLGKEFTESSLFVDTDSRDEMPIFTDCTKVFRRTGDAIFWAPLRSSATAIQYSGSATGVITGTISYPSDRAYFRTTGINYITWTGAGSLGQTGCVRFNLTPSFNAFNDPTNIFTISNEVGKNTLELNATYTGGYWNYTLELLNSAGSINFSELVLTSNDASVYYFSASEHEIEVNWDFTVGNISVFVDGVVSSATFTGWADTITAGTRTFLGVGVSEIYPANVPPADSSLWNFLVFDTVQHTSDYTPQAYQPVGLTVYSLDHLEGKEVAVLADGNYAGDFTVASGQITLPIDYTASKTIIIGAKYTHTLETQPVDIGSGIGSSVGSVKRIDRAVVRFRESAACKVGWQSTDVTEIDFRDISTPMNEPTELVTDDKVIDFRGDYDRLARIFLSHDAPLPCNITCISLRGMTSDV